MEEFKEIIRETPSEMLNTFLAIYKDLLVQVRKGSPAYNTFSQMINCIENEMRTRGINGNGSHVSETEKREAINYLSSHGVNVGNNSNSYRHSEGNSIIEGAIGIGGIIALVIVYVICKSLFEGAVTLWNNGILKVVLGLAAVGTGTYIGYKKGLFKKIKDNFNENENEKSTIVENSDEKSKEKEKTKENVNIKEKENIKESVCVKEKEETKEKVNIKENTKESVSNKRKVTRAKAAAVTKLLVKDLVIYSSALVVFETGLAHLDKNTKVLEGTFLEKPGKGCRCLYEIVSQVVREKEYELFNDYSEFTNIGYMDYIDPSNSYDKNNLGYQDRDCYLSIDKDDTWEGISNYCYGTPDYAIHLRLYNSRYDLSDDMVYAGDMILVPNPDKLEDYIYEKAMIKIR